MRTGSTIKYRVWYPNVKKFYYLTVEDTAFVLGKDAWCEPYTLQRFTGAKDDSGKEVYEGDVVKTIYNDGELGEVVFCEQTCAFRVMTNKRVSVPLITFRWVEGANDGLIPTFTNVVGNVCENPTLPV